MMTMMIAKMLMMIAHIPIMNNDENNDECHDIDDDCSYPYDEHDDDDDHDDSSKRNHHEHHYQHEESSCCISTVSLVAVTNIRYG